MQAISNDERTNGNWYFTFGLNSLYAQKYVKFENMSFEFARDNMFRIYGHKWAFQYNENEFLPQITKYNLTELK